MREHIESGRASYRAALAAGDARGALGTIDDLIDAGVEFDDLCEDVLRPALYEIGELWETGAIHVADEHLAASISETVLACIGALSTAGPTGIPRALVCASDGELHAIGARMVAESLAALEWSVRYLGASTPPAAVAAAVVDREVDVLALSTTMPAHLPAAARTVELVRQAAPQVRIVVGGQAYRDDENAARAVGADLFRSDLRELAAVVDTLAG